MFRCRDRRPARAGLLAAAVAALAVAPAAPAAAQDGDAPVGEVLDIIFPVESIDGTELEERSQREVTVTITSDVLFDFDEDRVTGEAEDRLAEVADQIRAESDGGVVTVEGHTDDQGSTSYNQDLSQRRAESVREVLAELLSDVDVTFETVGHGESEPRVPNRVDGEPDEENRAKNRRVEITYQLQG